MKDIIVEFLGTFILIIVILLSGQPFTIGLTLALIIYIGSFIRTSKDFGSNFNPAVSFTNYLLGNLTHMEFALYVLSQLLAGLCAYIVYKHYIS